MKNILFDSDVILDFYLDRMPYCDTTAILLSMCETKQIKGYITADQYAELNKDLEQVKKLLISYIKGLVRA